MGTRREPSGTYRDPWGGGYNDPATQGAFDQWLDAYHAAQRAVLCQRLKARGRRPLGVTDRNTSRQRRMVR